jgi:hypothetical protein
MISRPMTALSLGVALALSAPALSARDDDPGSPVDDVTQPIESQRDAQSDRSRSTTGDRSSSPLGANPARQDLSFGMLDANTDGKLSRDEVRLDGTLTTRFDQLDADRNNALSNAEFARFEASDDAKSKDKSDKSDKPKARRAEDKVKSESRNAEEEVDERD